MAAPRLLPSGDELLVLRRKGWTTARIAEKYGVTPAAVSAALAREGKSEDRRRYPELIPWRVRVQHGNDYNLRMLRWEGQLRSGKELPEYKKKALASWRAKLRSARAVIHYDPDLGFFMVEARPQDTGLVRVPDTAA